jgi:uncharacterized protein with NRDE domain
MCLIAVAVGMHPRWPLVLVGNRDEFHARPTAPAGFLDAAQRCFGGRDMQAGGGWLQVDARGRLAAVTNVRRGVRESAPRSRGGLVQGYIAEAPSTAAFLAALADDAAHVGAFNLLLWDGALLHYASNHPRFHQRTVPPGVHALSNADLDTPWPKTAALRARLADWLAVADTRDASAPGLCEPLFAALADPHEAPDHALPNTGVPLDWERRLSAAFIRGADYGTRASSVVLIGADGMWFEERRFGPEGQAAGRSAQWLPRAG